MVHNTASEVDENIMENNRSMKMLRAFSSTAKAFATLDTSELMGNSNNRVISRRILCLVLCICGMLNFYVYNAGLTSSLTVKRYNLPINSLEDILNNPEYKLLVWGGSVEEDFLRYDKKYHKLWEKSRNEKGIISGIIEGETQIKYDNKKILLSNSPSFESQFESYPCKVTGSKMRYGKNSVGYAFAKGSPYTHLFNYHIRRINEEGWETEWGNSKQKRVDCGRAGYRAFAPKDVIFLQLIFGLGCLLAVLYCVIEIIYTKTVPKSNSSATEKYQIITRKLSHLKTHDSLYINQVSQIDQKYTSKIHVAYHGEIQEVDQLLEDVSQTLDKIINLLNVKH